MATEQIPSADDVLGIEALDDLLGAGWKVSDLRGTAHQPIADLVLTGPPGVFAIRGLKTSKPRQIERALQRLRETVSVLADMADVHKDETYGVLCFTDQTEVDGWRDDVTLCSPDNLADIIGARRPRLDNVEEVADRILKTTKPNGRHRAIATRKDAPGTAASLRAKVRGVDPALT